MKKMITIKELKNIFNKCPDDWNMEFRKWEHGSLEDFKKKYPRYPMPNLVSIKVKEVITTVNEDHEFINHKFVLEDEFESDFMLTKDEAIEYFCGDLADFEMVEFVLNVKDTEIPLEIEAGDKGYSDRIMMINFEEI